MSTVVSSLFIREVRAANEARIHTHARTHPHTRTTYMYNHTNLRHTAHFVLWYKSGRGTNNLRSGPESETRNRQTFPLSLQS